MTLNPEVQARAQAEIDAHLASEGGEGGISRLPTWDDEDSLPYVAALVKEVLRWQQVTPLGRNLYPLV